jgi:hypothetical protein
MRRNIRSWFSLFLGLFISLSAHAQNAVNGGSPEVTVCTVTGLAVPGTPAELVVGTECPPGTSPGKLPGEVFTAKFDANGQPTDGSTWVVATSTSPDVLSFQPAFTKVPTCSVIPDDPSLAAVGTSANSGIATTLQTVSFTLVRVSTHQPAAGGFTLECTEGVQPHG